MKNWIFTLGALVALLVTCYGSSPDVAKASYNQEVLRAIKKMPNGGGYSTGDKAHAGLSRAVWVSHSGLRSSPRKAKPSYCSGGTYLVLIEMIKEAEKRGDFKLSKAEAKSLLVAYRQPDGEGVWGRWNANGPGAAKLVKDLGMGINFESYAKAQPGDFMKIFWSDEIGKREFGHLVIYLGTHIKLGREYVRFWSCNQPSGYGVKSVPKSDVKWAIFTRVTNLKRIKRVDNLSAKDKYLASMLTRSYSRNQVRATCSVRN